MSESGEQAPAAADVADPVAARGLEHAFEILSAAQAGGVLLADALDRVVAELQDDSQARSAVLGALAHICLVAVGTLAQALGEPVEAVLPLLREAVNET